MNLTGGPGGAIVWLIQTQPREAVRLLGSISILIDAWDRLAQILEQLREYLENAEQYPFGTAAWTWNEPAWYNWSPFYFADWSCETAPYNWDPFFNSFKTRAFVSRGRGAPWTTLAAALRMRRGIKYPIARQFYLFF